MSTEIRDEGSAVAATLRPSSPSRESTFSGLIDPSAARMRILVAPYYSPYVVSVEKVQTWEGLILMLQRLFGPTFCSLSTPPKITLHRADDQITEENWSSIVCADCCIVVHTKSEETKSSDASDKPENLTSSPGKDKLLTPRPIGEEKDSSITSPTSAAIRDPRARLINKHANSGFATPNIFDERNYTTGPDESKDELKKRKRKGSWWDSLLTKISVAVHLSSPIRHQQQRAAQPSPMGTSTHISAMERNTSKKLRQSRRVKGKRVSRVIVQANPSTGRPVSIVRTPVKPRFSSGNILRQQQQRKRSTKKTKRRSIPPPHQSQKPVRRHMGRSHSDCSSCFCDDDDKRDSLVIAPRHAGSKQVAITTTAISLSTPPSSHESPYLREIDVGAAMNRAEKTDSFTIFTSPIIEEFSLQAKKKARPPSSAAATKTSSVYYESTPPPVPKRNEEDETGFHAQYRLLDEQIVRSVVKKAAALKKADEKSMEKQSQAARHSQSSRSSTTMPKRSNSMGHSMSSASPSGVKRSGTVTKSVQSRPTTSTTAVTIDPHYKEKHSSTSSRAGTVNSAGSRCSSSMGFRRQSTPFDNKPLPKLPGDKSASSSIDLKNASVSSTGAIVMPPIATFEDLMKTTNSSPSETAEIGSGKEVTMVAGQPELR